MKIIARRWSTPNETRHFHQQVSSWPALNAARARNRGFALSGQFEQDDRAGARHREGTVKVHLVNIYEKLGVGRRTGLIALMLARPAGPGRTG
jgi:hypothetical protein